MARELILLRTSERSQFKTCKFAWDVTYNQRLKPKVEKPALRFGSLIHKALELRYPPGVRRGPHPAKTFEKLYEEELDNAISEFGFKDEDGEWHNAREMGVDMMNHFVDHYGSDKRWKVIASEQTFQLPIRKTKKYELVYVGTFDGVWQDRDTGEIWLTDWKTAKSISTKHLTLDEQAGAYWAFGPEWLRQQGILKPKMKLSGILYTFLRKATKDPRPTNEEGIFLNKPSMKDVKDLYHQHDLEPPANGEGSGKDGRILVDDLVDSLPAKLRRKAVLLGKVSDDQPGPYFHRERVYRGEVQAEQVRHRVLQEFKDMRRIHAGKAEPYKSPSAINCAMCGVRDYCELHEMGADFEEFAAGTMREWDPYEAHEEFALQEG